MARIRLIVAGSRTFKDYDFLKQKLDSLLINVDLRDVAIVSGRAQGADRLGERYAWEWGLLCIKRPAKWDIYGKAAGHIRNEEMARLATHAVIFWDGKSPGSKDMIALAERYHLRLRIVKVECCEKVSRRVQENRRAVANLTVSSRL